LKFLQKTSNLFVLFVFSAQIPFVNRIPIQSILDQVALSSQQLFQFEPSECMLELPIGVIQGEDIQCGYLTVPAEHALPDGPTIKLAVVIIKSKQTNPKADPLFMAQGGPGGSTIDTYAEQLLTRSRLLSDRDIVLFDQRGTLYSQPTLLCTEFTKLIIDTVDKVLSDEESDRLELEALSDCRKRLTDQGIDLSVFDSVENAADIEALRRALGYDQINLYGVSYGTLLALHTMREFPQALRSVILDSTVPPQSNFLLESAQNMDRAFKQFFEACENDPHCNQDFPNLEKIYFDLVEKLDEKPAHVTVVDDETGEEYNALIDGETFQWGFFQMLYATSLIPALPRMIKDASEGKFEFFSRILSILLFDRTMSYGMYYSVLCAEDAGFDPNDQDLNGVHPSIAEMEKRNPSFFLESCRLWNVEPLDSQVNQPVVSDIPTLVLSGEFDPITPPKYGQLVAASLSNSFNVVFPAGSHGAAMEGECQDEIILSFLENPDQFPDTSCIQNISNPVFYTSRNLVDVPGLVEFLNADRNSMLELLVLVLLLAFLLTSCVVFPIAWLVKRIQNKPLLETKPLENYSPFLLKAARWLAVTSALVLFIFLIGLFIVLFDMALNNDNRLFFGVNARVKPWFLLPMCFAFLVISMTSASLVSWRRKYWYIWMRVYYTMITLAALGCLIILLKWGWLTVLV